jgi:CO/xanthine dehydrogenase Mo-binding subunit
VSTLGSSPPRPDGASKVGGTLRYANDLPVAGLWYGATLRSPHPHARIRRLQWHPERAPAGAVCVTAGDLPGPNGVQLLDDEWPVLAADLVQHVGEPVAVVAAPSQLAARQALAAIEVDYEPIEPVLDFSAAGRQEPLCSLELESGNAEEELAKAHLMVEGTYRTGHQEHIYIECQVMSAWWEADGTLIAEGSMQCPYFVHRSLVHALRLAADRVVVKATPVGGGFGGKEDFPSVIALHAALLAKACGNPVRIAYDRHEDIVGTTKRHPSMVTHRAAVDSAGRLQAMEIEVLLDGGAFRTLSPVVLSRAVLHAVGPYRCPNVHIRGKVLRTNTPPNGAFRGFGAPQVQFATERQMDRIGRRLGLDPLEIRLRNVLEEGDRLPTGQRMDESCSARLCLEKAARETDFQQRWQQLEAQRTTHRDGEPSPGVGLSLYFHGAGFTGNGERVLKSVIEGALLEDGRVEVRTAAVEMGQGCDTVFPMMAAEASGLSADDVVLAPPDTSRVPDSGPSVASRTSMVVGSEVAFVVSEIRDRVLAWWSERQNEGSIAAVENGVVRSESGKSWSFREVGKSYAEAMDPLVVSRRHEPPEWQVFDEETYQGVAYPTYAFGADVVEVEVDPDTLEVRPKKVTAVCEVGRVLHEKLCVGQVEGGTLQAVAWGLLEEIKVEQGRYLNDRLSTYIIPTIRDSPEMEVFLLEKPWKGGAFGAKGVGELPMDGGAPAAVSAVENATGIEVDAIPATPERLLALSSARRRVSGPPEDPEDGRGQDR